MTTGRSTEVVSIVALVCGPDFQELMNEPRVRALAERVAINGGSATLPIVRASDMEVIAGEDIIAAHCLLDIDELRVELVHDGSFDDEPSTELSPDGETRYALGEVARVVDRTEVTPAPWTDPAPGYEESLLRLPEPAASSVCVVAAVVPGMGAAQLATLERVEAVQAQAGTQKAAVKAVAAETGRSEHAVKKAANRARRAKDKVDIQCWGRPQPEAWLAPVRDLRRSMTSAANSIRTAMSSLSPLLDIAVPGVDVASTYQAIKEAAVKLMNARPACVCAWCKNEPLLRERCTACHGRGWLSEKAMSLVPRELMAASAAMDCGQVVTVSPADIYSEAAVAPFDLPDLMHNVAAVDAAAKSAVEDYVPDVQTMAVMGWVPESASERGSAGTSTAEVTSEELRSELADRAAKGWPMEEARAVGPAGALVLDEDDGGLW